MTCNTVQEAEIPPACSKPFFAANTAMNSLIIADSFYLIYPLSSHIL